MAKRKQLLHLSFLTYAEFICQFSLQGEIPMTDKKSLSQARYNQFAQGYVTSQTHAKGTELERLVAVTNPQPDWIALDVATGGGHTALKFASYVSHVTATDLTPKMLDAARTFITEQGISNLTLRREGNRVHLMQRVKSSAQCPQIKFRF